MGSGFATSKADAPFPGISLPDRGFFHIFDPGLLVENTDGVMRIKNLSRRKKYLSMKAAFAAFFLLGGILPSGSSAGFANNADILIEVCEQTGTAYLVFDSIVVITSKVKAADFYR